MKPFISLPLVVEGTNDASYISSMYEIEIIVLNGYECPKEELDYLKELSKKTKVLLLTDPDKAGQEIRGKLHQLDIRFTDLNVDISKCQKGNKHGVAECEKEEIHRVFEPFLAQKSNVSLEFSINEVTGLGLNKETRNQLCTKFHLGKCNNKKMAQRLNSLGVNKETFLKEVQKLGN